MPLTDDELNGKFLELAIPVIGVEGARALLEQLWRTEKLPSVDYTASSQAQRETADLIAK